MNIKTMFLLFILNISLLTKTKYKIVNRTMILSLDYQNNILNYKITNKRILWYTFFLSLKILKNNIH